jgi:paraquat-inducible protein A
MSAAAGAPPPRMIECPNCGLAQFGTDCMRKEVTFCCRCGTPLARRPGKSLDATLACAITTLLLLIPASSAPFLTTSAFGASRTSILPMSALFIWREGWPLLAVIVFLFLLVFPAVRLVSLTAVLLAIRSGRRPRWLGFTFRLANALQTWAMLDVFLLGLVVAYARLRASIHVTIDTGAMCFVAAAVFSLFVRATLDKPLVWQMIAPDQRTFSPGSSMACLSCGLLVSKDNEGRPCPRCTAIVRTRRPESVTRSIAFLIAAVLLYFPANLYPIATIPIDLKPTAYTVLGGILDLSESHLLGLALLVFCASFAIPILKIAGLSWCIVSTMHRSNKRLVTKTRLYRVLEEIGRWSMVDPLTIACFVPVLHFNGLIDGRAEPAATPFAAVAILTTLAVKFFDPRVMWDAAEQPE